MINETEIRIGNWFEHDGKSWSHRNETARDNFNFQWTYTDWYAIGECTISLEVLNPIPLTVEILRDAGFEKKAYDKGPFLGLVTYWVSSQPANLKLAFEETTDGLFYFPVPLFSQTFDGNRNFEGSITQLHMEKLITHVHQLQNLNFALTGAELDIKL